MSFQKVFLPLICGAALVGAVLFIPVLTLHGGDSERGLAARCSVNLIGMKHGAYEEFSKTGQKVLSGHFF